MGHRTIFGKLIMEETAKMHVDTLFKIWSKDPKCKKNWLSVYIFRLGLKRPSNSYLPDYRWQLFCYLNLKIYAWLKRITISLLRANVLTMLRLIIFIYLFFCEIMRYYSAIRIQQVLMNLLRKFLIFHIQVIFIFINNLS